MPRGFRIEAEIEFDHPLIGRQALAFDGRPETFRRDIARARTFGFMRDVAKLWSAGYALGASLENTLVVTDNRVLNPEGPRFPDEFVRHKVLDAIGDLALAGAPLLGAYRSVRGGHKLNYAVLSALMADTSAWALVEAEPVRAGARPCRAGDRAGRRRPSRRTCPDGIKADRQPCRSATFRADCPHIPWSAGGYGLVLGRVRGAPAG